MALNAADDVCRAHADGIVRCMVGAAVSDALRMARETLRTIVHVSGYPRVVGVGRCRFVTAVETRKDGSIRRVSVTYGASNTGVDSLGIDRE